MRSDQNGSSTTCPSCSCSARRRCRSSRYIWSESESPPCPPPADDPAPDDVPAAPDEIAPAAPDAQDAPPIDGCRASVDPPLARGVAAAVIRETVERDGGGADGGGAAAAGGIDGCTGAGDGRRCEGRGWGRGCDRRLRRRCRRDWRSRCTLDPPGWGLAPLEAVNRRARRLTALGARGTPGRRGWRSSLGWRGRRRATAAAGSARAAAARRAAPPRRAAPARAPGQAAAPMRASPAFRAGGRAGVVEPARDPAAGVGVERAGGSVEVRATWLDRAGVTTSGRGSARAGARGRRRV